MLLLSSLSEIKIFRGSAPSRVVSLCWACLLMILQLTLIVSIYVEWIRSRKPQIYSQQTYFKEFFGGLRDSWFDRSYLLFSLGRRCLLIGIVMTGLDTVLLSVSLFWGVQLCYCIFIVWRRPFASKRDNVIEVMNECFFTGLSGAMFYLNKENRWSKTLELIYTYTIVSNTLLISLILLVSLGLHLRKKCFKYKTSKETRVQAYSRNQMVSLNSYF